jgi:hypothetical protein
MPIWRWLAPIVDPPKPNIADGRERLAESNAATGSDPGFAS